MASRKDLVTKVWQFCEKTPFAQASQAQRELVLFDVNRSVRYVYNNGDLSFKTVVLRGFDYIPSFPADLAASRGTPLPLNFMGFHQTGGIYMEAFSPKRKIEHYLPYHQMMDRIEGWGENYVDTPTHWSLGGPSMGDEADANYGVQPLTRELLLWPVPAADLFLTLVYQRVPQPDATTVEDDSATDWSHEIFPIPATWHDTVILTMAILFRKQDKGSDDSAAKDALATAIKQMGVQEPHGREKPAHRPIHPAWIA
jgi:hypothetical protein